MCRPDPGGGVEVLAEGTGPEIELSATSWKSPSRSSCRCRRSRLHDRNRAGDADRVGDLDLAAVGGPGGNHVLGGVTGCVLGGERSTFDGSLPEEGATAVTGSAIRCLDDDLAAGRMASRFGPPITKIRWG